MRILIRRPHAYKFLQRESRAPIPGLILLAADGEALAGSPMPAASVDKLIRLVEKHAVNEKIEKIEPATHNKSDKSDKSGL